MRKITIAALAAAATFAAAPAFAQGYGHSHGHHHHHGHFHGHVQSYHHHTPTYHAPAYVAPVYVAPKVAYVAPQPTTSYETRPAYVYQKVAGYCTDVVKSYGYNTHRKTVECKAGEAPKVEVAPEVPVAPIEPPK